MTGLDRPLGRRRRREASPVGVHLAAGGALALAVALTGCGTSPHGAAPRSSSTTSAPVAGGAGASADGLLSILATLRFAGAPATFFLTGDFARSFPALAAQLAAGVTTSSIVARVMAGLRPGGIVLMHVGSNPTDGSTLDAVALPAAVAAARGARYMLVSLSSLVGTGGTGRWRLSRPDSSGSGSSGQRSLSPASRG
jgi:hypothetical protein